MSVSGLLLYTACIQMYTACIQHVDSVHLTGLQFCYDVAFP